MTSLLSRLQSATDPSEELDIAIAVQRTDWTDRGYPPPRYTESIDAVVRDLLCKRPAVIKFNNPNGKAEARVGGLPGEGFVIKEGEHVTPALALLIAIERAEEESKP